MDDILEVLKFGLGALIIVLVLALRVRVMDGFINGTNWRGLKRREKEESLQEDESTDEV